MKRFSVLAVVIIITIVAGCDAGQKSSKGFSLPDGDVRKGLDVYQSMQCNACHTIDGVEQLASGAGAGISVKLGGKVNSIKTYGELVTSVINPSHRLAKGYPTEGIQSNGVSKMRNYNDVLTVSQLINLVAFLQSKYELAERPRSDYPLYEYPMYDYSMSSSPYKLGM